MIILITLLFSFNIKPSFGKDLKNLSLRKLAPNFQIYPNNILKKKESYEEDGIPYNSTEFNGENSHIRFLSPNLSSPELYSFCTQKDPKALPSRILIEIDKMKRNESYALFLETLKMGCDQNLSGEEIKENLINSFKIGIRLKNSKNDVLQDKKIIYAPQSNFLYFSGDY
jgi:hypothetical protein